MTRKVLNRWNTLTIFKSHDDTALWQKFRCRSFHRSWSRDMHERNLFYWKSKTLLNIKIKHKMPGRLYTCITQSHLQIHCMERERELSYNFHCLSLDVTFNVHRLRKSCRQLPFSCTFSWANCLMSRKIVHNFWTVIPRSVHRACIRRRRGMTT